MGYRVPSLRAHKGSWQAVCVIRGKSFYLAGLMIKAAHEGIQAQVRPAHC